MRSLSSSANNPIMPSAIRATLVSSDSVIQPADPYSAVSSNVSCVISHLISSLPTTSLLLSKMDNHVHLKKSQPLMQIIVNAHSALSHCKDGKEWQECACGCWVHELRLEDVIIHVVKNLYVHFALTHFLSIVFFSFS